MELECPEDRWWAVGRAQEELSTNMENLGEDQKASGEILEDLGQIQEEVGGTPQEDMRDT